MPINDDWAISSEQVPHGTAPPPYVTSISLNWPNIDVDTWYFPNTSGAIAGQAGAVLGTIAHLPETYATAAQNVATNVQAAARSIVDLIPWIVIGAIVVVIGGHLPKGK